jgi:hypothetical protein
MSLKSPPPGDSDEISGRVLFTKLFGEARDAFEAKYLGAAALSQ